MSNNNSRRRNPPPRFDDYETSNMGKGKSSKRLPTNNEIDRVIDYIGEQKEVCDVKYCTTSKRVEVWHKAIENYKDQMSDKCVVQSQLAPPLGKQMKIISGQFAGTTINIYDNGTILIQGKRSLQWADKEYPNLRLLVEENANDDDDDRMAALDGPSTPQNRKSTSPRHPHSLTNL
jgi:hypothetical protein